MVVSPSVVCSCVLMRSITSLSVAAAGVVSVESSPVSGSVTVSVLTPRKTLTSVASTRMVKSNAPVPTVLVVSTPLRPLMSPSDVEPVA